MANRRRFLKISTLAGGALGAGLVPDLAAAAHRSGSAWTRRPAERQLRVLMLGGTGFLGPHIVRTLLARGHTPVLFNRGRSQPRLYRELFTDLELLIGDRDGDLSALEGGRWDAVIDTSGYTPDQVRATTRILQNAVEQYLFTSTRAVYASFTAPVMHEDAPVGMPGVPEEEWDGYGPLKVLAERAVQRVFPQSSTIVRPCIITGPGDTTDRFTYWYVRVDRGGEVLAPGNPTDPVQYIDVRDLAEFYVHLLEEGTSGVFNLEAPASPLSSAEFLYGVRAVTSSPVSFTWVDWDFLEARDLSGGQELPGWRAPRGEWLNYGRMDNRRAIAAGLGIRPLAVTAAETLEWWKSRPAEDRDALRAGPSAEREREVVAEWRARPARG